MPKTASEMQTLSPGVKFAVDNGTLLLAFQIDPATLAAAVPSASGKSKTVASTRGNVVIPGTNIKLGLNAYIPV